MLGVFLFAAPALLAAPSLTAQLDRQIVPVGENVTLSLIFQGAAPGGTPNLPALPNLNLTGPPGESSEFTIVNGQTASKKIYNYSLVATQPGDITIPGLQITVDGQILNSQPLSLKIVKTSPAASAEPTNVASVQLVVPKNEIYLGEPFPVEIQLDFQNAQDVRIPQLKAEGFSLGQSAPHTQGRVAKGNAVFNRVVFKMSATAAKTGTLSLGPAQCNLVLLIPVNNPRRNDPFDNFFGFGNNVQRRPVTLASEAQPMRVLPLPAENVPAGFNGAVGHFALTVNVSPTNLAVGDPITVRVQIAGRGLLDALTLPPQPHWRDFKTYPPTSSVQLNDPLGLSGAKTFEQVVIPQNHEIKTLPPFEFSYFDSDQKSYRTLTHPATPLTVRPGASVSTPLPSLTNAAGASNRAPPADDIEHIRPRLDAVGPPRPPLIAQAWFLSLQSVPLLTWLSLLLLRKRNESLANNPKLRRQRQVARRVRNGLTELRALAAGQHSEDFFAMLFRLLQEQLGERLDLPASAITEAVIDGRLRGRNLSEQTLNVLHELFQTCNQARYAPQKTSRELAALVPKVEQVLCQLRQLKA